MATMTKERQGEIALEVLKRMVRDKGIRLSSKTSGEIQEITRYCSFLTAEAMEFYEIIARELLEDVFHPKG